MRELLSALIALVLLCASAAAGFYIRPRLPHAHRSSEVADVVRLISSMLVTFAVLVLGLLTSNVKAAFDAADHDRGQYAAELTQLDQCLRNYGPAADPMRGELRTYVAAVIASTWPSEAPPSVAAPPGAASLSGIGESQRLGTILNEIDLGIRRLPATDGFHATLQADCGQLFRDVTKRRWTLIGEARGSVSRPFYAIMVFWLMVVFAGIGLFAPRNATSVVAIALGAMSLTSALFVILDLDVPYGGLFEIPSTSMRSALDHMSH